MLMKIPEFIEKAIRGGWNYPLGFPQQGTRVPDILTKAIFLDPLAWQAAVQAEGWNRLKSPQYCRVSGFYEVISRHGGQDECNCDLLWGWHYFMLGMTDALCDGKTIEAYLETL